MNVNETGGVQGPQRIQPTRPAKIAPAEKAAPAAKADRAEISSHARFLDQVRRLPDVRQERIDLVKAQIDAGTYETEEKLEQAVKRLLDELG